MCKLSQVVFIISIVASIFASTARAECRRTSVCDNFGQNCRYQDVCDNKLDLPSIGLNPLPSLPSTELKPLPSTALPPLGTSKCEYQQVNGQWQNICH